MTKLSFSPIAKVTVYTALIYRLLLAFIVLFLCRLIYFALNLDYFDNVTFDGFWTILYGGLRFDITALLYLNSLYLLTQIIPLKVRHDKLYQLISFWIFVISNAVGIIMNIADAGYYQFTLKRTTSIIFEQFANESNLPALFFHLLIDYWYLDLIVVILTGLLVVAYKLLEIRKRPADQIGMYTLGQSLMMLGVIYFTVVGIRGGFGRSTRPITLSSASAYVESPNQRALVLNTPFAIIRTIKKKQLTEKQYFDSMEVQEKIFSALHPGSNDSLLNKKNVVIFILESFGTEHIGALNQDIEGYNGYTPFLDSLIEHSYTFKYSYANGGKSISGMSSVLASIPSLVNPFVLSH